MSYSNYSDKLSNCSIHNGTIATSQPFQRHTASVSSVAFSPDGQTIASGSEDKTVRLWDLQGQPIGQPCQGHQAYVSSVVFSPDGQTIASGSADKTLRLWDVQTGLPVSETLQGHTDSVWSVAFSPDGRRIVSGIGDKTLRLWSPDWSILREIACNCLRYHPLLNQPEKIVNDPDFIGVAHRARAACQQDVWRRE